MILATFSSRAQTPASIVVDGKATDWPAESLQHDKTGSIEHAFVLDGGRFFILLRTGSPIMQAKILKAGMTVYLDGEGKKKSSTGIQFPLPKPDEPDDVAPTNMSAARVLGLEKSTEFTLRKFKEGNGTYKIGDANPAGVQVAIAFDDKGVLVYEASLPFQALFGKAAPEAGDAGKVVDAGFVINALPEPHALASADPGASGPPPAGLNNGLGTRGNIPGGGLPGAAPRAGNGRDTPEAAQEAFRSTKFWDTLTIK